MSTIPAIQSALFGIRENLRHLEETAARLARDAPLGDLAADVVHLNLARAGVQANVKAARAADEVLGSLLDLLA